MAIIKDGLGGTGLLAIDTATDAARVQDRPLDVGTLGAYQISGTSGTMAAGLAGGSTVFSCRWGDSTRTMLVRRVGILAQNAGTAFAAGLLTFDMIVARAFTASDSAQTTLTPTANSQKKRTSFGTTLLTDLRISNTAAITVGTRTLDAQPLATVKGAVQATATNYIFIGDQVSTYAGMTAAAIAATSYGSSRCLDIWFPEIGNSWPLVLVQNEGFIIRATVPATGTWTLTVEMEWAEVASTAGYN